MTCWISDRPTDWLTDWLTLWVSDQPMVWLTDWLTGWLAKLLTDVHVINDLLTDWQADQLSDWWSEWLPNCWTDRLTAYWLNSINQLLIFISSWFWHGNKWPTAWNAICGPHTYSNSYSITRSHGRYESDQVVFTVFCFNRKQPKKNCLTFNPWEWLASNFSHQHQCWHKHWGHEKKGNDH